MQVLVIAISYNIIQIQIGHSLFAVLKKIIAATLFFYSPVIFQMRVIRYKTLGEQTPRLAELADTRYRDMHENTSSFTQNNMTIVIVNIILIL